MRTQLLSALLLSSGICMAQMYDPAASAGLPDGAVGQAYSTVINVNVPTSVAINTSIFGDPIVIPGVPLPIPNPNMDVEATVTSVTLAVAGLPGGLSHTCSSPGCVFAAGASGTITISGNPTAGGNFQVDITSLTNGSADIPTIGTVAFPQPVPGAFDETGYAMSVAYPEGIEENADALGMRVMAGETLESAVLELSVKGSMPASIRVTDIQGRTVSMQHTQLNEGVNRFDIRVGTAPGMFMVLVETGGIQAVRRFVR